MFKRIKEDAQLLNKNIKEILKLFLFSTTASVFGSVIFPIGGIALSFGIFLYIKQVMLTFAKTNTIEVEELEEPFLKGIVNCYIFKLILKIIIAFGVFLSCRILVVDLIKLMFEAVYIQTLTEMVLRLLAIAYGVILIAAFLMVLGEILFPFTQLVFLDEDFKENNFFKNIKVSFALAKGYRLKVLLLLLLNCIYAILSIFTFGLAMIYFYPLYLTTLSKLYLESKERQNVLNNH